MKVLLEKLIRAKPTAENGEKEAAKIIAEFFMEAQISAELDVWDDKNANITTRIESGGGRPAIMFLCHLDVVPAGEGQWGHDPFKPTEKEGKLFGRGSADMLGGLAAGASAVVDVVKSGGQLKGDIIFAATAGEEVDSCGVKRFMEKHGTNLPAPGGIIIPEPTDFEVVTAHKGICWLKITTSGKTAHGSMPELGINAVMMMNKLLNSLEKYKVPHTVHPVLGGCTLSVNTIHGGKATNVVPDRCSIEVDIRMLPGQDYEEIIAGIEELFRQVNQGYPDFIAEIEPVRIVGALETDSECDFVRSFCKTVGSEKTASVSFTTDGPHLAELNAPVVIFGPGKPALCHKPNEYIEISDLEKARQYYTAVIKNFLL